MLWGKKPDRAGIHPGRARGIARLDGKHEAGPYQTIPYPGQHWQPEGEPGKQPHEYAKNGTAKLLTLFHPATGKVHVKGVTTCPNAVLHSWLQQELTQILALLPDPPSFRPEENRARWHSFQEGLQLTPSIGEDMPPLRLLLVLDKLSVDTTRPVS